MGLSLKPTCVFREFFFSVAKKECIFYRKTENNTLQTTVLRFENKNPRFTPSVVTISVALHLQCTELLDLGAKF